MFKLKMLWQKLMRGFSDEELWNLDDEFCKWIVPRLIAFKKKNIGYPNGMTWKQWQKKIDQMIEGFSVKYDELITRKKLKKSEKAMETFSKHWRSLWW